MKEVLALIWEIYKSIIGALSVIILFLFAIIGGEFKIQFYWHHVKEFIQTIKKLFKYNIETKK